MCLNGDCAYEICRAEIDGCMAEQSCVDFNDCYVNCVEGTGCVDPQSAECEACISGCEGTYPEGVEPWYTMMSCLICFACYGDCDGQSFC